MTFFSSKLSPTEHKFDNNRWELLDMKMVLEKRHHWLNGDEYRFMIFTVYKKLENIRTVFIAGKVLFQVSSSQSCIVLTERTPRPLPSHTGIRHLLKSTAKSSFFNMIPVHGLYNLRGGAINVQNPKSPPSASYQKQTLYICTSLHLIPFPRLSTGLKSFINMRFNISET